MVVAHRAFIQCETEQLEMHAYLLSKLELGDVGGAFLEADKLDRVAGNIWASLPRGGLPGVAPGSLLLLLVPHM